jgi:hypothetical protein
MALKIQGLDSLVPSELDFELGRGVKSCFLEYCT